MKKLCIVAALLENNQTPQGICIPKALVPYTGFDMIDSHFNVPQQK